MAFLVRKSPAAAERLGLGLVESIFGLADFPMRGMPIKTRPSYRRILHQPWHVIFYRLDEAAHTVEIVRIWDGRRNPTDLSFNLP